MSETKDRVLEFIQENDVKFIRLVFCDIFGTPKNVAVMADHLPQVLETGTGFDASAVDGFINVADSDLQLHPDPATLAILPWRPQSGRVARMYCNLRHQSGETFAGDGRSILRAAKQKAMEMGIAIRARCESEFYLFDLDDNGKPTTVPHDNAGYLDIAPLDRCENVRRDICLALEELGMSPMGSHHEKGPGQNEIWCQSADVLTCADDLITYKTVVRTIAAQHGLFASFMPKPFMDKSGSGLHINLSLSPTAGAGAAQISEETFRQFLAGILERVREMTMFLNSSTNSYLRLGNFEAPAYVSWAEGNRSQLVRVPLEEAGGALRMELRSPDSLCNPYYAMTLLLLSGLEGIAGKAVLPSAANVNLSSEPLEKRQSFEMLPTDLGEAIAAARSSEFVARSLPKPILDKIFEVKQYEWERYQHTADKQRFEHAYYFGKI